jgi:hypothetical protein
MITLPFVCHPVQFLAVLVTIVNLQIKEKLTICVAAWENQAHGQNLRYGVIYIN